MNILAPISSLMTTKLITVNPEDKLSVVKEIFNDHNIHHIPVVRFRELVGIISKSDLLSFLKGMRNDSSTKIINNTRLNNYTAQTIMTRGVAKLEPDDKINVALEIFKINKFHALPVIDKGELVGILTTYDILNALTEENANA